jgi:cobalamin biosynthesis protein CobT
MAEQSEEEHTPEDQAKEEEREPKGDSSAEESGKSEEASDQSRSEDTHGKTSQHNNSFQNFFRDFNYRIFTIAVDEMVGACAAARLHGQAARQRVECDGLTRQPAAAPLDGAA